MSIVIWLFSCSFGKPEPQPECYNDAQCDGRCVDNHCVIAECRSSLDCDLYQYCQEGECQAGCQEESDCFAGEDCIDAECQTVGCEVAQLDCSYGEDCVGGSCVASDFPLCEPCRYTDWQTTPNGVQECIIYSYTFEEECYWQETTECSGDYSCYPADGQGASEEGICVSSYFFQPCTVDTDCPRPFTCKEDVYQDESGVNVCWADCPFWREQGIF
jgi:hypothetical protein